MKIISIFFIIMGIITGLFGLTNIYIGISHFDNGTFALGLVQIMISIFCSVIWILILTNNK